MQKLHSCYNKIMLTDEQAVRTYFAKLGLEREIADIYLALHTHGPQTISELSRTAKVERTRIYRLIDKLMGSNLIEVEAHYKRGIIKAAPIANLRILITEREQELKSLQDELELIQQVLARNSLSNPATRVQFYRGAEGHKQMMWNEARAGSQVLAIVQQIEPQRTGKTFFDRWVDECNKNDTSYREIHSDDFRKGYAEWYRKHDTARLKTFEARYVSPKTFRIRHSTDIYNDVIAHYLWKDGEIFGVEIHNKEIADEQRQFFELLWEKSEPESHKDRVKLL